MTYEAIILAGGRSSRAGTFKPALDCAGVPLVLRVVQAFVGVCRRIWVVTGYRGAEVASLVCTEPQVEVVNNRDWEQGMFSSVRTGVARVESDRFFLTPGDLPLVSSAVVRVLTLATGSVVVPLWAGRGGHPILLERRWATEIQNADPHSDLRTLLEGAPKTKVPMKDDGVLVDIDTGADYQAYLRRQG